MAAGLLDESSGAGEVEVVRSPRATVIVSRLAVLAGVLLLVGVLIAIRLFVHIEVKTDWRLLCLPTTSNATTPLYVDYAAAYPNVTLAPCNETVVTSLPPTTWSAYVI